MIALDTNLLVYAHREDSPHHAAAAAALQSAITAPGGFSYVQRKVDLAHSTKVEELGLEGIGQHPDTIRTRPQGPLAGQLIGAVSEDGKGLTGLELGEDSTLHGVDGERQLVNDALGDPISLKTLTDAQDGAPVKLTIDASVQAEAEKVLAEVGATHDPVNASAIVMDTRTSQVLAMASWPPVDLDDLGSATSDQLLNLGTGYNFEPGSTFKAFTVASALESGTVSPTSTFTLPPTIQVADRVIEESHPRGTVTLGVGDILAQSSNVGSVTIGLEMGGKSPAVVLADADLDGANLKGVLYDKLTVWPPAFKPDS